MFPGLPRGRVTVESIEAASLPILVEQRAACASQERRFLVGRFASPRARKLLKTRRGWRDHRPGKRQSSLRKLRLFAVRSYRCAQSEGKHTPLRITVWLHVMRQDARLRGHTRDERRGKVMAARPSTTYKNHESGYKRPEADKAGGVIQIKKDAWSLRRHVADMTRKERPDFTTGAQVADRDVYQGKQEDVTWQLAWHGMASVRVERLRPFALLGAPMGLRPDRCTTPCI